jgi:dihydrofolate reductase
MEILLVAAVAENGVIGRDGGLPWRLKSDLRHFRSVTMHKPLVMGRRTWESISKALPGRTNIVVTRDPAFTARGAVVATSLAVALEVARGDALRRGADSVAVIGGGDIYAQLMPAATCLEITRVHARPDGEAVFPTIDPALWRETARRECAAGPGDETSFAIVTYRRSSTVGDRRPQ